MKKTILCVLLAVSAFFTYAQQTLTASLSHDGLQREYILYVPADYDGSQAFPLVMNFHGFTSNANDQMWYGDFRAIADTAHFLVVHPQGTRLNGSRHWNVGGFTTGSTVDDLGFTAALIDTLSATYNIDSDRVYATGMSNGGYMSFLLACQLSDRIAAIASVTGAMTSETFNACDPQHPTPIMQIHGTLDPTVPYNGTVWSKSIDDILLYWRSYNRCDPSPTTTAVPNTSVLDGSTAEHMVYENGDQGSTVEHFRVINGGHTWPGSIIGLPGTNQDFNASLEIWKFFSRYTLRDLQGTTSLSDLSIAPSLQLYPNPARGEVWVQQSLRSPLPYQLLNVNGQQVEAGVFTEKRSRLNLSSLSPGIYFLVAGANRHKLLVE
jgi:polyhydroxybutyrate depolymerase